jgi:hypothetical protein
VGGANLVGTGILIQVYDLVLTRYPGDVNKPGNTGDANVDEKTNTGLYTDDLCLIDDSGDR